METQREAELCQEIETLRSELMACQAREAAWKQAQTKDITEQVRPNEQLRQEIAEREKAERELQTQISMLDGLLDGIADIVEIWDPNTLEYIKWNKTFNQVTGYSDDEIAALNPFTDFFDDAELERAEAAYARLLQEGQATEILTLINKYGNRIPVEYETALTRDVDGSPMHAIAIGREIAERLQAEERLRFQAHLLASIEQAVVVTDMSGHIVYWNPFAERLFGWSAEEVIGRKTIEFFFIADEQARQQHAAIMASMRTCGTWSGEYVARRRDGTHLPLQSTINAITDAGGELTHIVGVMTDITERKQTEEALRKSEKKHRDLVEKISDVIYAVDSGGLITYLNPAIEALLGLTPEQVVGQPFAQFIHPEDLGRLQDNMQSLFSGEAPGSAEYRVLSPTGKVRWIRAASQPMVEEGQFIGVQGVLSDVTERKRLEEQLQEVARVSERQRLARDLHDSVTQTLYSTSLFADATHLALSTGSTDSAREHLDEVRDLLWQAMLEMRMLLFELRPPLLEEIGLAGALQTRLESVEARVGLPIDFVVEGERQLPSTVEAELYRVALEALNNIVKHAHTNRASVHLTLDEERCRLVIRDDGTGFDPDDASQGGGQGLRSMQERVAQIGGRLDLETAPGQGTTITVEVKA